MIYVFLLVIVVVGLLLLGVHLGFRVPRLRPDAVPADFGMAFEAVSIPTRHAKRLSGWLLSGGQKPDAPALVIVHGWGANAAVMLPLAEPFVRAGYNVLLFDARNHGRSPADGHSSMPKFAEDAEAALDWLTVGSGLKPRKTALLGHSVGAAAVLLASSRRRDVEAVISISSFAHPEWLMRRELARVPPLQWVAAPLLRYVQWVIGHRFQDIAPVATIGQIGCPALLVHGAEDEVIPLECFEAIRQTAGPMSRIEDLVIDGAGHASVDKIRAHAGDLLSFLRQSGF